MDIFGRLVGILSISWGVSLPYGHFRRGATQQNLTEHCEVTLDRGSGRIRRTGSRSGHQTWWPLADFDILANCRVVEL